MAAGARMVKVVSYTPLLYGADFLEYAIRSVIPYVDEHHIIYSPIGAHGHVTDIPCPDRRYDLMEAARRGAGDKLRWHDAGPFPHEGFQRESIHRFAPDSDVILAVDCDEIWPAETVVASINMLDRMSPSDAVRTIRLPMIHLWRSFYRAVLHDPAFPTRVIFPKIPNAEMTLWTPPIVHAGYAQRSEVVDFKQLTHGHRNEWRKDCDWFRDRFMANAQVDTHPVGSEYWNPEPINPWDYLPEWMKDHPYAKLDLIP